MEDCIQIVWYNDSHRKAFKNLNQEWIEKYFTMEAMDHHYLDHPKENIIDKGGYIAVALYHGETVGVCALIKSEHSEFDYELTKMGVSPNVQGKGIGTKLGQAIIQKAREIDAKSIFLESHSCLKSALRLYKRLGFKKMAGVETPYERSDVQMALHLY